MPMGNGGNSMSVTETRTDSGVIVVPELATRYRLAESQLALLPPADEDDAEEWYGLRFQCEEVMMLIERISRAEERERVVTDSPEQMRERCFHDFLRLIRAYMNFMDQEEACVLQRFSGFVEQHGIPGLGTGTCDCGEDDCPYKAASAPCDCGLPDCSDPRSTKGGKA